MSDSMYSARNLALAGRAKVYGANYALRIVYESKRVEIPVSAGFALIEKESNFKNVFGHDNTGSIPNSWKGTKVTKVKYQYYKSRRDTYGAQGVGPAQPTYPGFQDTADRLGGCWIPKWNIHVGLEVFAGHFHSAPGNTRQKLYKAAHDYNGTGAAADAYAKVYLEIFDKWHKRLN